METLVGHRNTAKAVPGQLPLFLAKSKATSRTFPLVTTLGKLCHCCTTLLANNFFLKSKLNLPSCVLGVLPLIVPSASTRRNLGLPSVQFPLKLLWGASLSCCFARLNEHRFLSLFSKGHVLLAHDSLASSLLNRSSFCHRITEW